MSRKKQLFASASEHVIVGVVREDDRDDALAVASAYARNGLRLIEITFTTPGAVSLIARLRDELDGVTIAAGSLRSLEDAASAAEAGAQILVSPHTCRPVLEFAAEHDLLAVAGASTPTEIVNAWEGGADVVKVYPVMYLGGPDYIRTIRQPIRDIPLLAGGPVPLDAIDAYLDAGVVVINLGGSLAVPELVRAKNWDEIGRRAARAVEIIQRHRGALASA